MKHNLKFCCSDSKCKAFGYLDIEKQLFTYSKTEENKHIEWEKHSYIITDNLKNKFDSDNFLEQDFFDNNNKLSKYNIGIYFKLMFLRDYNLMPTFAKINFHKKFPNIDITQKEIDNYIYGKYREARVINKEKMENIEKIFHLKDDNGIEIAQTIDYEIKLENNETEKLKFIIIANKDMLLNLKNNLIDEFFIDTTYSCVPPSVHNFKLFVINGFEFESKKTDICSFILIMNEKYETFTSIFDYLKNKYNFNPKNMMSDFRMSQIKAIQKCFPHCNIHGCFFHFSQSIWRNFKKYGLGGKEHIREIMNYY